MTESKEVTFDTVALSDPLPGGICEACASSAMQHVSTKSIFVYCAHYGYLVQIDRKDNSYRCYGGRNSIAVSA